MNEKTYDRICALLTPLIDAGWNFVDVDLSWEDIALDEKPFIFLERTSFHLGVGLSANSELVLSPSAEWVESGNEPIGPFDILLEPISIGSLHDLDEAKFAASVAELGLTEPTRLTRGSDLPPDDFEQLIIDLYATYVFSDSTQAGRESLQEDPDFSRLMKLLPVMTKGVVPDPIPLTAAMGIVQCCWRNTALEGLHQGPLTDVQMAKLTIATTRAVAPFVSSEGVDWDGLTSVLLDPDRRAGHDGYSVLELVDGDENWRDLKKSVQAELTNWQRFEATLGAEAILRLLTLEGTNSSTYRWWGNGGWAKLVREVFPNARLRRPQVFPEDPVGIEGLIQQLIERPEDVSEEIMEAMIDANPGPCLRYGSSRAAQPIIISG